MMKSSLNIPKWHVLHLTTFWRLSEWNLGNIDTFRCVFSTGKIHFFSATSFHNFLLNFLLWYCLLFWFHSDRISLDECKRFSQSIIEEETLKLTLRNAKLRVKIDDEKKMVCYKQQWVCLLLMTSYELLLISTTTFLK